VNEEMEKAKLFVEVEKKKIECKGEVYIGV